MPFDRKTIRRRRNLLLLLVAVAMSLGLLAYAANWWLYGRFWIVTDNAFVTGNLIPVYADATGVVVRVYYEETEHVKKGDLVIRLDAQRAEAALGEAQGELAGAVRKVGVLFAARRQACQRILSRAALLDKVRHDIIRYQQALPSGSVSNQVLQNAQDQGASLEADLKAARADFQQSQAQVGGTTRISHPDIEVARNKFINAYIEFARQQLRAPVSAMSPSARRKSGTAFAQATKS